MTTQRRTGVLLSGYYGCGNLGDDLLLTVSVEELRPILSDARFLLRDHGVNLPQFGPDVVPTGVDAVLDDRSRSRAYRLALFIRRMSALLRQCRWLIYGGGTVFHRSGGLASLTLQWLICRLARSLGVRVAALGVGINDLSAGMGRWLLRDLIGCCDLFLVRDEAALRQCAGTKARLTGDLVFALRSLRQAKPRAPAGPSIGVGLTVSPAADRATVSALAAAVRRWRELGHRVVFLVFQRNAAMADDTTVFAAINRELSDTTVPVEIRNLAADAPSIVDAFSDIDVVCGMRFHSLVLAAMLERPFVGIAHDHKISEICRQFGMPCRDAATLDGDDLARLGEDACRMVPDTSILGRSRELAEKNFTALATVAR
jgi:polysaccharide pyruvyl transferase WcaK-like protein